VTNFKIAQMVGDSFGRDYQYWPSIKRSEIPFLSPAPDPAIYDEIWPVDITLEQLLQLTLRIRNWDFSGNASAATTYNPPGGGTPEIVSGSANIAETQLTVLKLKESDFTFIAADKETDIIGRGVSQDYKMSAFKGLANYSVGAITGDAPVSAWSTTSNTSGPFSGSTPSANVAGALTPGLFTGMPVLYDPVTKLFSPPFTNIGSIIPTRSGENQFGVGIAFKRNPQTVLSGSSPRILRVPGVMSVVFGGIVPDFDVPIEMDFRLVFEAVGGSVSGSGSCDFTLEATDWWQFKNSLGQLVYDEADGHQIADPFA